MKIVRFLGRHLTGTLAAVFLIVFLFSVFRYTGLDAAGRSVHIGKERPVVAIDAGHGRGRVRPDGESLTENGYRTMKGGHPMKERRKDRKLRLREYRREDLEEMERLFFETVHTVNAADYTKEQLWAWADNKVDHEAWHESFCRHRTVIAQLGERIAGFGDMAPDGYLDRLYVHREEQGHGVGTAICDYLEGQAAEGRCGTGEGAERFVTHASVTAKPFFEKRGYRVVKEQQVERKGVMLTNYIMEKETGGK